MPQALPEQAEQAEEEAVEEEVVVHEVEQPEPLEQEYQVDEWSRQASFQ